MVRQERVQEEAQALLPGRCDSASAWILEARGTHCFICSFLTRKIIGFLWLLVCLFDFLHSLDLISLAIWP